MAHERLAVTVDEGRLVDWPALLERLKAEGPRDDDVVQIRVAADVWPKLAGAAQPADTRLSFDGVEIVRAGELCAGQVRPVTRREQADAWNREWRRFETGAYRSGLRASLELGGQV